MNSLTANAKQVILGTFSVALMLAPSAARAAEGGASVTVTHLPGEHRLVVTIGPLKAGSENAQITKTIAMPTTSTLFRTQAVLEDAMGRSFGSDVPWSLTLYNEAPVAESYLDAPAMLRLSAGAPEMLLPRPWGLRFTTDDSIRIVAALPTSATPGTVLRITLEYESSPATRLSSRLVASEETVATGSWTWRSESAGRLVAIIGAQLVGAQELILEDVVTGSVIWSTGNPFPGGKTAPQDAVVHVGVPVEDGRLYRLRAVYSAAQQRDRTHGGDTPLALFFPARAATAGR